MNKYKKKKTKNILSLLKNKWAPGNFDKLQNKSASSIIKQDHMSKITIRKRSWTIHTIIWAYSPLCQTFFNEETRQQSCDYRNRLRSVRHLAARELLARRLMFGNLRANSNVSCNQSQYNRQLPKNVALPRAERSLVTKMAVPKKRAKTKWRSLNLPFLLEWIKALLFDPSKTWIVGLALLLAEIVVNILVIWKIKCEYFSKTF